MRILWAFIGFLSVFILSLSDAQSAQLHPDLVRVRLMTAGKKIKVSGVGLKFQSLSQAIQQVSIPMNNQAEIRLLQKDGKNFWGLKINSQDYEHLFAEKYFVIQGESMRIGTQTLPDKVLLSSSGSSKVDVVGVLPLDEYVIGVLSSEMPSSWPLETLKAQAVAIRSYTLAVMSERKDRAYHVESSVMDQVFRHVLGDEEAELKLKKAIQAVKETEGMKLIGPDRHVLKAFYHSDCGGRTTTAKNVWQGGVDAGVAVDSSCPTGPHSIWNFKISKENMAKRLNVASFTSMVLVKSKADNRVQEVRVALNDGTSKSFSANEFRQILGFQELRSTAFDLKVEAGQLLFNGKGFGHGVGLCQWGSRVLGTRGATFKEILTHYYPLARLK
ncbi:stage II sporulation protein D [Bdellovibrio sp. NC01]|nr:stage II sporulation protein D [Bdellovibrio sp. NC01]